MKILILSDGASSHTLKWVKSLAENGIKVALFSINKYDKNIYSGIPNISLYGGYIDSNLCNTHSYNISKIAYFKGIPVLKKVIKTFKPDILHAHYLTSYGLIGALTFFKPFVISVWGSDIFDFPKLSLFHKALVRLILKKADVILSTSNIMAKETNKYTKKTVKILPFGTDLETFKPKEVKSLFNTNDIVIGTVKSLSEKYGIKYLVQAFNLVKKKYPELPLKLLLVGGGEQTKEIQKLLNELGLEKSVIISGAVPYNQVNVYHNMINISVFVSTQDSESFGVSATEASACSKPLVVSHIGGLPEVVEDGITGIIVPPKDVQTTAKAIEKLVLDKELRERMGKAGRERVKRLFNWNESIRQMISVYKNILGEYRK